MRKPSKHSSGNMDFIFSMLLFLVFILCSVFTILIGSRVYGNIRERNDAAFYSDTALSYITNKVRQFDKADCIDVRAMDNENVLVLTSEFGGILYETWIYTKDGSLLELFSELGSGLTTEDGLPVMDCPPISFYIDNTENGKMLRITLDDEAFSKTAVLFFRSHSGGGQMP